MDNDLLASFLEDRDSLSAAELDRLIAELLADPDARRLLRGLLQTDDLIGRSLAPDRADFVSQVKQRLLDLERRGGAAETEFERAVLRRTARASRARWLAPLLAAAAVALVVAGAWWANTRPGVGPVPLARLTVESATELAAYARDGEGLGLLKPGVVLQPFDSISVPTNGKVVLAYAGEATRLTLGSGSRLQVRGGPRDSGGAGKRLRLSEGTLEGTIAAQPAGQPMIFETPLARATVLGTDLRLTSDPKRASLDVAKGSVRFEALASGREVVVEAGRQGVVRKDEPAPKLYGEVLLAEDFEGDLSNWVILKEYGEERVEVDTNILSRVRIEKRSDGKPGHWLVIDGRGLGDDIWVAVRAKPLFSNPSVRLSLEYMGEGASRYGRFNFTVYAPGGEVTQKREYENRAQLGVLCKAETAWQQRVVEGGCEVYARFSLIGGKPTFEHKIFYKGADKAEPWLALNVSECVITLDNVQLRTMEPLDVPELPKVVKAETP